MHETQEDTQIHIKSILSKVPIYGQQRTKLPRINRKRWGHAIENEQRYIKYEDVENLLEDLLYNQMKDHICPKCNAEDVKEVFKLAPAYECCECGYEFF